MKKETLVVEDRECQAYISKNVGTPILFLHGYSYTSEIWDTIGVLEELDSRSIPFLALDMPYGKNTLCKPKSTDEKINVKFALGSLKSVFGEKMPVVIVGASLGGYIAINCAINFHVKGLLLVSPTRTEREELVRNYKNFDFLVTVIWGSKDRIVSNKNLEEFVSHLPNTALTVYQNAGHSAYKDFPQKFKQDLVELYNKVSNK